jgi:hypothetical protein
MNAIDVKFTSIHIIIILLLHLNMRNLLNIMLKNILLIIILLDFSNNDHENHEKDTQRQ